jgi:hypothetical protein
MQSKLIASQQKPGRIFFFVFAIAACFSVIFTVTSQKRCSVLMSCFFNTSAIPECIFMKSLLLTAPPFYEKQYSSKNIRFQNSLNIIDKDWVRVFFRRKTCLNATESKNNKSEVFKKHTPSTSIH